MNSGDVLNISGIEFKYNPKLGCGSYEVDKLIIRMGGVNHIKEQQALGYMASTFNYDKQGYKYFHIELPSYSPEAFLSGIVNNW